jgi:15-cis-phytoene synthase
MSGLPVSLEATYAARAIPKGGARYWAHFFAADTARAPLLGVWALLAEWQALIDPSTEQAVAQLKFGWWQEEIRRLTQGRGAHPISVYLSGLPGAGAVDFGALQMTLSAAIDEASGVPLERAADLAAHAKALWGQPLEIVSAFTAGSAELARESIAALAQAEHLTQAIAVYRRAAKFGRVCFPVDELLGAHIENADLIAAVAPPKLHHYLLSLRQRAGECYQRAQRLLPQPARASQRHLLVLAALGRRELDRTSKDKATGFRDMLCAWRAARRAPS